MADVATTTALVNTAPVIQVALLGAALAAVPLLITGWRSRGATKTNPRAWLAALTLATLFLTFDLVLFGSFTRLTDSGLGCPDWPGCYGHATPLGASDAINAAQSAMPDGPVTKGKAWIEMLHRYFAAAVGALIVVMTLLSWRLFRAHRPTLFNNKTKAQAPRSPWWATVALLWVIVQGAFGALTVTMKLYPAIVTTHLMLGLGLLALLAAQSELDRGHTLTLARSTRRAAWGLAALLGLQLALGGWVSTNYAVLACQDFPTCQGRWWPPMDFEQGFALNRALGRAAAVPGAAAEAGYLPFAALTAIHMTHRAVAVLVVLATCWLAWCLRERRTPQSGTFAWGLLALLAWQVLSGISNVVLGWPIAAALAHVAGACGLVIVMTTLLMRSGKRASRPIVRRIEPTL